MGSEQEQGGSEPSKIAVGNARIAQWHVVGGDAHIAPPTLGSNIGEITQRPVDIIRKKFVCTG